MICFVLALFCCFCLFFIMLTICFWSCFSACLHWRWRRQTWPNCWRVKRSKLHWEPLSKKFMLLLWMRLCLRNVHLCVLNGSITTCCVGLFFFLINLLKWWGSWSVLLTKDEKSFNHLWSTMYCICCMVIALHKRIIWTVTGGERWLGIVL